MPEGTITTHAVRPTPDGKGVEVIATLDAGEVLPGMFLHVPLNGSLDFTAKIASVSPLPPPPDRRIRIVLDCGGESEDAAFITAIGFENETLQVLATGEE